MSFIKLIKVLLDSFFGTGRGLMGGKLRKKLSNCSNTYNKYDIMHLPKVANNLIDPYSNSFIKNKSLATIKDTNW